MPKRRERAGKRRWIQRALKKHKRGALHRMMNISVGERIPSALLRSWNHVSKWVAKTGRKSFHGHSAAWWRLAGRRVRLAMVLRRRK